jgi:acyl-CoA synthetase (AMP-forming)/AMP-acid ligase II
MNLGEVLTARARLEPSRIGLSGGGRALSYGLWNARACRLANALLGLGLGRGDRVAILAYNRPEWLEIYAATAKAGLVTVPVNFRLVAAEIAHVLGDSGAAALIVEAPFRDMAGPVATALGIPPSRIIALGENDAERGSYEDILARAAATEPGIAVAPADPWAIMYTSGTTGRPKGAVRSHGASALLALVTGVELGFHRRDEGLVVMPLCHGNSLFFATALAFVGAPVRVHARASFDPGAVLADLAAGPSFTSLVPTHYVMMLELSAAERARHDLGRVRKLMISSAPARVETKRAVMEAFPAAGLWELYGSTEAGWVTMLQPEDQFAKLGSVGRECVGSPPVRLLDEAGAEVADGEAGELFSRTPYTFSYYWNLPEKTAGAFRDGYCTVGDMARRDADGFLHLVDRKANMIISGGANIYPSEVEAALGSHPAVLHCAAIGLPDPKWGERVHGVVVLKPGAAATAAELVEWCRSRLAGYKRPRSIGFVADAEMPKTATGKIQHRLLRARLKAGEGRG